MSATIQDPYLNSPEYIQAPQLTEEERAQGRATPVLVDREGTPLDPLQDVGRQASLDRAVARQKGSEEGGGRKFGVWRLGKSGKYEHKITYKKGGRMMVLKKRRYRPKRKPKKYAYQSREGDIEIQVKKDVEEFKGREERSGIMEEARRKCREIMEKAEEKLRREVRDYTHYRRSLLREKHEKKLTDIEERSEEVLGGIHKQLKGGTKFTYKEIKRWIREGGTIGFGKKWIGSGVLARWRDYSSIDAGGEDIPATQVLEDWEKEWDAIEPYEADVDDYGDEYPYDESEEQFYRRGHADKFKDLVFDAYNNVVKGKYFDDERQAVIEMLEYMLEEYSDNNQFLEGTTARASMWNEWEAQPLGMWGITKLYKTPRVEYRDK